MNKFTLSLKYFELAADQGFAEAQNNLGLMYLDGQGIEIDYGKAIKYFELAADQGHAGAQELLKHL